MTESETPCINCTNPFCSDVKSSLFQNEICGYAHKLHFKKRNTQVMFFDCGNVFIIEEGFVLIQRSVNSEKLRGTQILGPGDIIGIVQLYNHTYRATIEVLPLTPVRGCMVPTRIMEAALQSNTSLANTFIKLCTRRSASNSESLAANTYGTSRERLSFYLERIRKMGILSEVTQEDLALLSGLNRVTVTKLLNSPDFK